jgi:hypothetical protein
VRCLILTAVWGDWHTNRFISVNLPSLLAAKNLPEFSRAVDTTYVIATSVSDALTIRQSPAYQALNRLVQLRIVSYRDSAFGAPIATHMKIWRTGVRDALRRRAFYVVNPADMVWADGSFGTVARRLAAGKKALYAMFARVLDDTFTAEALKLADGEAAIAIPPRVMIDMTLRHLHPFHAAYLRDSDQFPFHPEYIYWPIAGEGLLMRSLATTVLGFFPAEYQVDAHFSLASVHNPDEVDFIDNSDDLCGVSLTPLRKDQNWYAARRTLDIDEVGAWWIDYDGPPNLSLARSKFLFHTSGADSVAWRRARQMSDFFVRQAVVSREIIRTARVLKRNGCRIAASILATALYAARLRRCWRWNPPLIIVVPNDNALKPHQKGIAETLLRCGREKELLDFVSAHIFPVDASVQEHLRAATDAHSEPFSGQLLSINGHALIVDKQRRRLALGGRDVLANLELPLGNRLYIVDGLLPTAALPLLQAQVDPVGSIG